MNESDLIEELQSRITFLEKHVTEQDAEMYQFSKKIDGLVKAAEEQKVQLAALTELSSQSANDMPADEKPPHYWYANINRVLLNALYILILGSCHLSYLSSTNIYELENSP